MKQQKAMLIALIVICLTVIVTALVTRKDLCEVRIRTGQTEVAVFTDCLLYTSPSPRDVEGSAMP
ncbi:hypothetical protein AUS36_23130, partial [Escherichia coli]